MSRQVSLDDARGTVAAPAEVLPAPASKEQAADAEGLPPARPSGEAAAAVLAAGVGVLALGGANVAAAAYGAFEEALGLLGRFLLPGGVQLGPYAGKELAALTVWLVGWALLHWRLRGRQVSLIATAGVFLACLVLGTLMLWPPIVFSLVRLTR